MIGGEHEPLTGALLREWVAQGFEERLAAWVDNLGGKIVRREIQATAFAEAVQDALAKGQDIKPLIRNERTPELSYNWDSIGVPPQPTPPPANPRWVWVMETFPVTEPVTLLGPKGGERRKFSIGWSYRKRSNNMPPDSWIVPVKQEGIGAIQNRSPEMDYAWLWGFSHVTMFHSNTDLLSLAIAADELMANLLAQMFNSMLTHMSPAPSQKAKPATPPPPTFDAKLASQQALMAGRSKNRREEAKARITSTEAAIKGYHQEIESLKRRLIALDSPTPNLPERLQAILDRDLCSAIKQDARGLWFLFDDIHAGVSPELARRAAAYGHHVIPGIYKLVPAVVHLPWGANGGQWVCGTLEGTTHPHPHAGNNGAFQRPCLGSNPGTLGPTGVTPVAWFAETWDTDPVKWAEAIHAFMRQTGFEQNHYHYRGIWDCGTLVVSHETKLKVTKVPTPTLTVNRLRPAKGA